MNWLQRLLGKNEPLLEEEPSPPPSASFYRTPGFVESNELENVCVVCGTNENPHPCHHCGAAGDEYCDPGLHS